VMLAANLGTIAAEFAGIAAALALFGVAPQLSSLIASLFVLILLARGNFTKVQYAFLAVGLGVSIAYAVSAVLARPDWGHAAVASVVPELTLSGAYLLTLMGVVGTTITPWGQAFIQSYVADKGLSAKDLTASRIDIGMGSFITNVVAAFIVVACAATIWAHGGSITSAADAALALGPLAGQSATVLFAIGLLAASLLGLAVVPLTSAYFACEAFGWESGLHWRWREAPVFYGLLAFFVGTSALFVVIPGLPLIQVLFVSQVFNALLLPFVLGFVLLISGDRSRLGPLAGGRALQFLGWSITILVCLMCLAFAASQIFGS
jgi:Mn2+/Fe2+ NRAMP family transporter